MTAEPTTEVTTPVAWGEARSRTVTWHDPLVVAAGVLEKRPYSETPPRSGYHLTASGRDLLPVLQALLQWGDRWVADSPPVELHHSPGTHEDHVVDGEWTCRTCGEPVNASRIQRVLTPYGRALSGLPTEEDDDDR